MRKVWLCIFYALCIFTIVFSLFWMALPSLPFPAGSGEETPASEPGLAAQGLRRAERHRLLPLRRGRAGGRLHLLRQRTARQAAPAHRHLCQSSARGRCPPAQAGPLRHRRNGPPGAAGRPGRINKNSADAPRGGLHCFYPLSESGFELLQRDEVVLAALLVVEHIFLGGLWCIMFLRVWES